MDKRDFLAYLFQIFQLLECHAIKPILVIPYFFHSWEAQSTTTFVLVRRADFGCFYLNDDRVFW